VAAPAGDRASPADQGGPAARAASEPLPVTLTLVRQRVQSTAAFMARLTATAVFAYLFALVLPDNTPSGPLAAGGGPVLAPLTALLVVQVTMSQTFRSAMQRVVSVVCGVLVALGLSVIAGFTWWTLAIVIAAGLALGHALRLGEHILEVPISAMLILSVGSQAAGAGRIVETLVGTGAGMVGGLLFARLRTQPAEVAIEDLSRKLAELLEQLANDVGEGTAVAKAADRLARARALTGEIQQVESALAQAEASERLNRRRWLVPHGGNRVRGGLQAIEHAALTIRGVAHSISEGSEPPDSSLVADSRTRSCLSVLLAHLAAAVRAFGRLTRADIDSRGRGSSAREAAGAELEWRLAQARRFQALLTRLLRSDPLTAMPRWPLRGELLTHLDRLRRELQQQARARANWARGRASRHRRIQAGRARGSEPAARPGTR
jgi:hypothetical protein